MFICLRHLWKMNDVFTSFRFETSIMLEIVWIFSTGLGTLLFLAEIAILCWVKFYNHSNLQQWLLLWYQYLYALCWYGLLCIFTDLLSNTSMKDHFRELKNFNRSQTNCTQIQGQHQARQQAVHDLITGFEVVCMAHTQCVMLFIGMLLVFTAPLKI